MLADYGAELVLTPAAEGMGGAVAEAKRIVKDRGGFFADQFGNPSSVTAHFETTAPEIFSALPSARAIVAGVGSGGTAMGIKKYIAEHGLDCKVFALEPAESPLMSEGYAAPHLIQGIGANFIPALVDVSVFDGILTVRGEDAVKEVGTLFRTHGIKCGISSARRCSAPARCAPRRTATSSPSFRPFRPLSRRALPLTPQQRLEHTKTRDKPAFCYCILDERVSRARIPSVLFPADGDSRQSRRSNPQVSKGSRCSALSYRSASCRLRFAERRVKLPLKVLSVLKDAPNVLFVSGVILISPSFPRAFLPRVRLECSPRIMRD